MGDAGKEEKENRRKTNKHENGEIKTTLKRTLISLCSNYIDGYISTRTLK